MGSDWNRNDFNHDVIAEFRANAGVKARVADGDERGRIWERQKVDGPTFAAYEKTAARTIPVVVLERGGLTMLADEKYIRFTTFKKDGTAVSSPTWIVPLDGGKVGFYTSSTSGKAKRLKNNPSVTVQPSDNRGRPKSGTSPMDATAVVVTGAERDVVYAKVVAKYGFMSKVTRLLAKVGGFIKRKPQPIADAAVVVTIAE